MMPSEFWLSSYGEIIAFLIGKKKHLEHTYNATRLIMLASLQPHSKSKIKPEDIYPLEMDSEKIVNFERVDIKDIERVKKLREKNGKHKSE